MYCRACTAKLQPSLVNAEDVVIFANIEALLTAYDAQLRIRMRAHDRFGFGDHCNE
jgi:hypothetical protein